MYLCYWIPTRLNKRQAKVVMLYRLMIVTGPLRWCMMTAAAAIVVMLGSGCIGSRDYCSAKRLERGYTLVLPGVEGGSTIASGIVKGLVEGGVPTAIEIHDWTMGPSFVSAVVNLRASSHNRNEARKIAAKIVHYQKCYPGRPVYLIGHSGGGGIAVYTLESLPPGHEVTGTILLAPALSPNYDLRRALRRTSGTIYNFFSPYDVGFLKWGTSLAGTIDGRHTKAAGAVGFSMPWGLSREDRQLYASHLRQQRYTPKMADSGHPGSHLGWAKRTFVAEWLAPLINAQIETQTQYASDTLGGGAN